MSNKETCVICTACESKYSCPKCNIRYCSVTCYRSETHLQCSEEFYEKCVTEELATAEHDAESKKRLLNILKEANRTSDESDESSCIDSDDNDNLSIGERFENIDLEDGEQIWKNLTDKEKIEFKEMITSGRIRDTLPDWVPWWYSCQNIPISSKDIPPITSLLRTEPSPTIPYMIINCLISYQTAANWFKGKMNCFPVEASKTILTLSECLSNNLVVNNLNDSYTLFETALSKCDWLADIEPVQENVLQDLLKVTLDRALLLSALGHMKEILREGYEMLKTNQNQKPKFTGDPPARQLLRRAEQKIIFYESYTQEYYSKIQSASVPISITQNQ